MGKLRSVTNGGVLPEHLKQDIIPNARERGPLTQSLQPAYTGQDALLRPQTAAPKHVIYLALIESKKLAKFAIKTLPSRGLHVHVMADMCLCAIVK